MAANTVTAFSDINLMQSIAAGQGYTLKAALTNDTLTDPSPDLYSCNRCTIYTLPPTPAAYRTPPNRHRLRPTAFRYDYA